MVYSSSATDPKIVTNFTLTPNQTDPRLSLVTATIELDNIPAFRLNDCVNEVISAFNSYSQTLSHPVQ